jgi:aminoglycoside 3-N-acetyltransferase
MEPEKGDPQAEVTATDVCRGFVSVGARPGDLLLYHGSLSSMGHVVGGPGTVIAGALQAVAPTGTVAMPTLWFCPADPPRRPENFDLATSPSYVGALSEAMRTDPRSLRSHHFSHSVSAIGPGAAALTADHGAAGESPSPWNYKAFADASPWGRLYAGDGLYGFIGVTMRVCTMKHYIESRYVARVIRQAPEGRRQGLRDRLTLMDRQGVWPFYDSEKMEARLAERGLLRYGRIGSATLRALRTRPLVDVTLEILTAEPEVWFQPAFLDWCRGAD